MQVKLIHNGQENLTEALDDIRYRIAKAAPGTAFKFYNVTDDDDETINLLLSERIDFIPTTLIYDDGGNFLCKFTGFPQGDDIEFLVKAINK